MLIVNARCKRCGGNLYIERNIEGDTLKCLACGFERDIPAEVKPVVNITQEVINVAAKIPETVVKTPGQILYEAHAKEAGLRSPWKSLGQENRERYERKANGTWERKQSVKKPLKPVAKPVGNMPDSTKTDTKKENIMPKYTCPYCEVGWSQADALIQHMMVCQKLPFRGHDAKPVLPPWNEAWGDSVKIAWLETQGATHVRS
jgi:DNA-directed RNA polymerase subunit M/transcription elongation factor TFIIS